MTPKCSLRTTQIFPTDTLPTRLVFLTFFVETHEISNLHTRTHAGCRRGAKMGALRKLITEEKTNKTMDLAIAALMIENVLEAKRQRKTHARCRLGPKMGALRKLITEENNGSRDAPTTV